MSWDKLSMQERADVMKLAVANGIYNLDTIRSAYNEFAEGGGIHIKPSHRGRLTELKERTGKTEAELKHDGNPAHKKMVVFAENARKWKHGLGGHIYDGTSEESQQMTTGMPWQDDWLTDEDAQMIEQQRHPKGHLMNQVTVSAPYASDSQRMKADLVGNINRAAQKNARDTYTLQRNMNAAQDNFAKNFGLNLYGLMGGNPLINTFWMAGATAAPEVGEAVGGKPGRKVGEYLSMASPLMPLGAGILSEASKIPKYLRLEKNYGGVPHKQVDVNGAPQFDSNGKPLYMDDAFPKTHGDHTVWTTRDIDYARTGTWSKSPVNTVFDIYTDPKELKVLDTPIPENDNMYYWQALPFDLKDGNVLLHDDLVYKDTSIPKSKEISILGRDATGRYDFDAFGTYVHKAEDYSPLVINWKAVPGAIKTDDVVSYGIKNGYDATRLHGIYDGGVRINGDYYDYN